MIKQISIEILLILFQIKFTQQNSLSNQTNQLQSLPKQINSKSFLSNKILFIIIICFSLIIIATALTTYFIRNQLKDFVTQMSIVQRGSVIHHFHPELLLQSSPKRSIEKSEHNPENPSSSLNPPTTNLSLYQ